MRPIRKNRGKKGESFHQKVMQSKDPLPNCQKGFGQLPSVCFTAPCSMPCGNDPQPHMPEHSEQPCDLDPLLSRASKLWQAPCAPPEQKLHHPWYRSKKLKDETTKNHLPRTVEKSNQDLTEVAEFSEILGHLPLTAYLFHPASQTREVDAPLPPPLVPTALDLRCRSNQTNPGCPAALHLKPT